MNRPRLLDLFCGAGGCARGYTEAGFDVVGVDIAPQPHYPFDFIQADALDYLGELLADGWLALLQYQAVHASPPCAAYSKLKLAWPGRRWPDLLTATRDLLDQTGLPYAIENVPGSPIRASVMLCGGGLTPSVICRDGKTRQLRRHRYFETNWPLLGHPCHHPYPALGVYGHGRNNEASPDPGGYQGNVRESAEAMAIEWMTREELRGAIPPAYTEYIGAQLLAHLAAKAA